VNVAVGARTDVGRVREANQDSFLVDDPLYAVADGMGGHLAGDVASATAVEVITDMSQDGHSADPSALESYLKEANRAIWEKARQDPNLQGMGTTCTLMHVDGTTVHLAHVGDSRAYLLRDGELSQITEDHTLVQRMVREGRLSAEEAPHHPQRSIITRALGVDAEVDVDILSLEVSDGDRMLLCSDGLSSMIDDGAIGDILRRTDEPQAVADALVEAANEGGGEDNVTVVVVDFRRGGSGAGVAAPIGAATSRERTAPVREDMPRDEDEGPDDAAAFVYDRGGGRGWLSRLVVTLLALALLGGLLFVGGRWLALDRSWFVGVDATGTVAVYKGIPDDIAGVSFKELQETSDVALGDLPGYLRGNVQSGIKVDSLEEARATVANLEHRSVDFQEESAPQPEPSPRNRKSN